MKMRVWSKEEVLERMDSVIAEWFSSKFERLTEPQAHAIPLIQGGRNVLVCAPTGSGKTLTAFLTILNELFIMARKGDLSDRVYCVYISPLKALANDIERNLTGPLGEIRELAKARGMDVPEVRVAVRTGDTSPTERQRQVRRPPHIFVTTPESFSLLLTARRTRENLRSVRYVIVDEVHDICPNKRGSMLAISLERLESLTPEPPVRIGLSATQAPIEEIARFLAGYDRDDRPRHMEVVDIPGQKSLDLKVVCPVDDLTACTYEVANTRMYDRLMDIIAEHRTSLVFTNTRSGAESVAYKLKERGVEYIATHHGSLGKETRHDVEARLKNGELKVVVTSTSLELGIDIGHIEVVVQIGSPKSVAKGIQRVGRAGHRYGTTSHGVFMVFDPDDLIECTVLTRCAREKRIDRVDLPRAPLDVLAQSIVALSLERRWDAREMYALFRRAHPYRDLPWEDFVSTLEYLSGRQFEDTIYGKIWYDPETGTIGRKRNAGMIYYLNMGTIPDEADYLVVDEEKNVIGDLSEAFVERLEPGDVFVLGGRSYEFLGERRMRVHVRDSGGKRPTVPSWTGEMLPRSFDLSVEIARFRAELQGMLERGEDPIPHLIHRYHLDGGSARSIVSYARSQMAVMGFIPNIRTLALEGYIDPRGNASIVFHFPFGRRVNDALSRAYAYVVSQEYRCNVKVSVVDDAFMLTFPKRVPVGKVCRLLRSAEVRSTLRRAVRNTELFKQRFRHCASRALMVLRNYKGHDISVARQFLRSNRILDLLHEVEGFPAIKETYQEILDIVMDLTHAEEVLRWIEEGECRVRALDYTGVPSPFAHNVILAGTSDVVLMEDRTLLLKELHRQVLARVFGGVKGQRFDVEKVKAYFAGKFGRIEGRADIIRVMRGGGAFTFSGEKGKNIYRYAGVEYPVLRRWGDELLSSGALASCYTRTAQYVLREYLPMYAAVYRRRRGIDEDALKVLDALKGGMHINRLREVVDLPRRRVNTALRTLEAAYLVERRSVDQEGVVWSPRGVEDAEVSTSVEHVVRHILATEGPLTAGEIAHTLMMKLPDIEPLLDAYVREGWVMRDMFILGDEEQYMLTSDVVRLQEGRGEEVMDTIELWEHAASYQFVDDIEDLFRSVVFVKDAFEAASHAERFDMAAWERMLMSRRVVQVRVGGRLVYMLAEDAASLSQHLLGSAPLTAREREVCGVLGRRGWTGPGELAGYVGILEDAVKDIVAGLLERCAVCTMPPEIRDDPREARYARVSTPEGESVPGLDDLIVRYLTSVPASTSDLASAFGMGTGEMRVRLERLAARSRVRKVRVVSGAGTHREVWVAGAEEKAPSRHARGVMLLAPGDVLLRTLAWDEEVHAIMCGPHVRGTLDLWVNGDWAHVPDVRCEDQDTAVRAIERLHRVCRRVGVECLKVDGLNSAPWPSETCPGGWTLDEDGRVYLGMRPLTLSRRDIVSCLLERQRVGALDTPEEMLDHHHGIRSIFELAVRLKGERRYDHRSKFPKLYEGRDLSGVRIHSRLRELSVYHAARSLEPLDRMGQEMLRTLRRERRILPKHLYPRLMVGSGTFKLWLKRVLDEGYAVRDWKRHLVSVPQAKVTGRSARLTVLRWTLAEFGAFTLDRLEAYFGRRFSRRELHTLLKLLVQEGYITRGFHEGRVMYMLDGAMGNPSRNLGSYVFTPEDRICSYLSPETKERFGWKRCYLVVREGDIAGAFRARLSGTTLKVTDVRGDVMRDIRTFTLRWSLRLDDSALRPGDNEQGEEVWDDEDILEWYTEVKG